MAALRERSPRQRGVRAPPLALLLLLLAAAASLSEALFTGRGGRAARCNCGCSSRMVPMLTCNGGPCCAPPCMPAGDIAAAADAAADVSLVEAARAAGMAGWAACANASLTRDLPLERPLPAGTSEWMHAGGRSDMPLGVAQYTRAVQDRCRARAAVRALAEARNLSMWAAGHHLLHLRVPSGLTDGATAPACNASARYRTFDGSCNNLQRPMEGVVGTPFKRLLCPVYQDGVHATRVGRGGGPLPSPSQLRQRLVLNDGNRATDATWISLLTMQWGQLVAHDTTLTAEQRGAGGRGALCCAMEGTGPTLRRPVPPEQLPSICLPADGPADYCLSIVRGNVSFVDDDLIRTGDSSAGGGGRNVGVGEQDNAVTHYLDLSAVYSSSAEQAASLRADAGRLREGPRRLLPTDPNATCAPRPNTSLCFVAGDGRVNQNPQLTILQTVMMREHNRVVARLAEINPRWDSERLFQEARRIVIAEYQHITYSRLVPLYIGRLTAETHGLVPDPWCASYDPIGYRPSVDASTLNDFATASYRVFHGLIQGILRARASGGCPATAIRLGDVMDGPGVAVEPPCRFDQLLRGLTEQPAQRGDRLYAQEMNERLFAEAPGVSGQDLTAFDIQRGRDHGLPPYCAYRRKTGGRCCNSWRDLEDYIDADLVREMRAWYAAPSDVDAYLGMFLERPAALALTGPTARAINLEQFFRWKHGDRFFYSFGGQSGSFTRGQLCELKKATAARLFCDNGDNITRIHPDVFLQPSDWNSVTDCQNIPQVDLTLWKE